MKKTIILLFSFQIKIYSQEFGFPNNDPNYQIHFVDDFSIVGTPSSTNWNVDIGVVSTNGGDPNPGYCTARQSNVKVDYGKLYLTALREDFNGYKFTGGSVTSKSNFNVGCYIECFAKLGQGKNLSAFWTWGGDGSCNQWLDYREIDIIEWFGNNLNGDFNIHRCVTTGSSGRKAYPDILYSIDNINSFHRFSTYWTTQNISIYIDDKPKIEPLSNLNSALKSSMVINLWNIKHPWYIYPLNSTFEIDYVRVWRLKECDTSNINQISNFNTFNYTIKKSYTLSNTTIFPTNKNISLRGSDFIELKNGFELSEINKDILLNTNTCD